MREAVAPNLPAGQPGSAAVAVGVRAMGVRYEWPAWVEAAGFGVAALGLRLALVAAYPALYGGDPIARMMHPKSLVLAYQLPLFQLLVSLAYSIADTPLAARLLSAAAGAFAVSSFYFLVERLLGRSPARIAAALFLVNPLFIVYSLMPYQEPLMIGLLSLAGSIYVARRVGLASVALGLACLTRYESWVVAAFLAGLEIYERKGRGLPRTLFLFGWAPLAWVIWNGGIAPPGTYVADTGWEWARLGRIAYLAGRIAVFAPYALVLAPYGLWLARRVPAVRGLVAATGIATLAIVMAGHSYPPETASVSERAAHIPLAGAIFLCGAAWSGLARRRALAAAVLSGAVVVSLLFSVRQMKGRTSEPAVAASYEIGRYLERCLGPGQRALVVARPVEESRVQHYLNLIEARQPGEMEAARRLVREMSIPEDFQRLAVSIPRGRQRLIEAGAWRGEEVSLAVVFEDASRRVPTRLVLRRPPEASFQEGKRASVFRVRITR